MKSLNAEQGKTINTLEKTLMLAIYLIEKAIKEEKTGVILNRGRNDEVKVKYLTAQKGIQWLRSYFAVKGALSLGTCETCSHFNNAGNTPDCFGKCKLGSKGEHYYDSCDKHSKKGGGFGIGGSYV